MVTGNLPPSTSTNKTTQYFNNFFTNGYSVSSDIDDAVIGYFQTITGDKDSGRTLASVVLYTSLSQGLDPMVMVDEFRKLQPNELNAYLTMFLNSNRVNTSLLGINNSPVANKYITRTILA